MSTAHNRERKHIYVITYDTEKATQVCTHFHQFGGHCLLDDMEALAKDAEETFR